MGESLKLQAIGIHNRNGKYNKFTLLGQQGTPHDDCIIALKQHEYNNGPEIMYINESRRMQK